MIAEIICVGTEILLGDILNTNAQFLSKKLAELGIWVFHQSVVGDNEERLLYAIHYALERSNIIILTGGLGPTSDDITKETVAKALNLELIEDAAQKEKLLNYFSNRGTVMCANNLKQAQVPDGAQIIENDNGTAPGLFIDHEGKKIIILPGPPNELIPMFEEKVVGLLEGLSQEKLVSRNLRLIGIGESTAASMIQDLIDHQENPTIAPYAKSSEVHFRVTARGLDQKEAQLLIDECEREIRKKLDPYIYTTEEKDLEEVIVEKLTQQKLKVSTAESCTGGLIASTLINVSGASQVFEQGIITYSNEAKIRELNVSTDSLERYGAVSEQVAKEMAEGIRRKSSSDIGIGITGIAGPKGGTKEKPVGLVYIGIAYKDKVIVTEYRFIGNRMKIRENAAKQALILLYKIIIA